MSISLIHSSLSHHSDYLSYFPPSRSLCLHVRWPHLWQCLVDHWIVPSEKMVSLMTMLKRSQGCLSIHLSRMKSSFIHLLYQHELWSTPVKDPSWHYRQAPHNIPFHFLLWSFSAKNHKAVRGSWCPDVLEVPFHGHRIPETRAAEPSWQATPWGHLAHPFVLCWYYYSLFGTC